MAVNLSFFKFPRRPPNPASSRQGSGNGHASQKKYQKFSSLVHGREDLSNRTLIFQSEDTLLRSSLLFPYFMLVAFEAGGLLRALVFFLLYPFACLFGEELGLHIKVLLCFFGIRKDKFKLGRAVLPKFFLEDVGREGFEVVKRFGRKVAVSDLPTVMVEGVLKDYLGVDAVVGRELKVVCGYFVGLMEKRKQDGFSLSKSLGEDEAGFGFVGIGQSRSVLEHHPFSYCKEAYMVSRAEKRNWDILPRENYPKPLVFHDGRLAFRPTQLATLAMFMWFPLGIFLFLVRFTSGLVLPRRFVPAFMALTGSRQTISGGPSSPIPSTDHKIGESESGTLFVCNHRTLLDPLHINLVTKKPVSAVAYGISKFNAVISPIKTVYLTRDREKDEILMKKMLCQGNLVVCPEGTTCREPYLLRFSPLFAELTDNITPVAVDVKVSMFYGTTASGLKCLDPVYHLMNPCPSYTTKFLGKLPSSHTCKIGGASKYEVANYVRNEIAKALEFECTDLTRKDKYMILAGNEGIIQGREKTVKNNC